MGSCVIYKLCTSSEPAVMRLAATVLQTTILVMWADCVLLLIYALQLLRCGQPVSIVRPHITTSFLLY